MKHLFVPYNIALIAKEKGFNEECCTYFLNQILQRLDGFGLMNEDFKDDEARISAPLYQQLIDWFRYKHSIVIWIETAPYVYTFNFRFYIETYDNRLEGNKSKDYYKVYNEALIEGFKLIK